MKERIGGIVGTDVARQLNMGTLPLHLLTNTAHRVGQHRL